MGMKSYGRMVQYGTAKRAKGEIRERRAAKKGARQQARKDAGKGWD